MATFCGQNLGAGRIDRVKAGVRNCLLISMGCCVVAWAISCFAGRFISLLFINASETMILDYTQQFLRVNALFFPMLGALLILRNSIPVSYTHLDVYKRQLLDNAVEACLACPDAADRFLRLYLCVRQGQLYLSITCLLYTSRCV